MGIIPILVRIGRLGDRDAFLDHSLDTLVLPAIGGTGPLSIATKGKGVVVSVSRGTREKRKRKETY